MILIHKRLAGYPLEVSQSQFLTTKNDTEISSKNTLPRGSLLPPPRPLQKAFIYRFTHSQWEEHSLFIPPSFSLPSLPPTLTFWCNLNMLWGCVTF